MSIAVDIGELPARIAALGDLAYLVTVGVELTPHVVSVRIRVDGDRLAMTAGPRTLANVDAQPSVTLLWPPDAEGEYSLIVDGEGSPAPASGDERVLVVLPANAVLHRLVAPT